MPLFKKKIIKTKADLDKVKKRKEAALIAKKQRIIVIPLKTNSSKDKKLVSLNTAQAKVNRPKVKSKSKSKSSKWATWSSSG